MNNVGSLPIIGRVDLKKFKDQRKAILFTGPVAEKESKSYLKGINFTQKIFIEAADRTSVEKLIEKRVTGDVGYAVGGGRVIDIAKLLAKEWKIELICIPTIISTDAFLVDYTGLRENNCVTYIISKKADKVLLDWDLLRKTPLRYHLSGCGDILSIYTGVYDWEYANKQGVALPDEIYSPSVAIMAKGILNGLLSNVEEIRKGTIKGLETIIACLGMEVALCNFYGNSRPEEGGEHFFTYCIENKTPHFLHGEMVCFGVLVTSFLQGQNWKEMQSFMNDIGLNYRPNGLKRSMVIETLRELPDYVKGHRLRHSIYNDFNYKNKTEEIKQFLKQVGL